MAIEGPPKAVWTKVNKFVKLQRPTVATFAVRTSANRCLAIAHVPAAARQLNPANPTAIHFPRSLNTELTARKVASAGSSVGPSTRAATRNRATSTVTAGVAAPTTEIPATASQAAQPASSSLDGDIVPDWLQRTTLLLGPDGVRRLRDTRVVVVGLGGVGSYVAEFLVRAGVGSLAIVDGDVVDVSNKNRQLPALDSTVGQPKAQVMARRLRDINPQLNLVVRQEFLAPDEAGGRLLDEVAAELADGLTRGSVASGSASNGDGDSAAGAEALDRSGSDGSLSRAPANGSGLADEGGARNAARSNGNVAACGGAASSTVSGSTFPRSSPSPPPPPRPAAQPSLDWVVDCIDSIAPKLALVAAARARGAHVVSSMGAGGRMDPLAVRVADVSLTFSDPFAANIRRGLRRQYGIRDGVTVVFSTEPCRRESLALTPSGRFKRSYYGTISFIPAVFGLQIAAHIINAIVDGPMIATEAAQRQQLVLERDAASGGATAKEAKARAKAEARARSQANANTKKGAEGGSTAAGVKVGSNGKAVVGKPLVATTGPQAVEVTADSSGASRSRRSRSRSSDVEGRCSPVKEEEAQIHVSAEEVRSVSSSVGGAASSSEGGLPASSGRVAPPQRTPAQSLASAVESGGGFEGEGI